MSRLPWISDGCHHVSPSTFCILSSFVEQSSDTCKTNSNEIWDNECSNYMKFLKEQGRDLEIIFPQVDVKIQGDSLHVLTKEIMLSQEVQYLGGYGRITKFPTVGLIVSVNN